MGQGSVFAGVVRWPGGANMSAPPNTVGGVFRLTEGATAWEQVTNGLPADCHVPCVTADPHDPNRIYAGTQEGPYVSTDGGTSWRRLTFPRHDLQVWSIAVHPANPQRLYVGTSPLGVFISDDQGGTWRSARGVDLSDVADMRGFVNRVIRFAFNPARPDEMFAAIEVRGVIHSIDGGESWTDRGADLIALSGQPHLKSAAITTNTAEGMLDVHAVMISPAEPEVPIIACRMGLFRSKDHGAHWNDLGMRGHSPIVYGRDIRVSPHDPATIYATLSTSAMGATGSIWRSTDLGRNWRRFDSGLTVGSTMMAVVPSPRNPDVVHAVTRKGQSFSTRDGGATWRETPMPAGCLGVMALAAN
jgi:hypothetical protein